MAEDSNRELLEQAIEDSINGLADLKVGSEEKAKEVSNIHKMYELNLESIRLEQEKDAKVADRIVRKQEIEQKAKESKRNTIQEYVKLGVPAALGAFYFVESLLFEQNGAWTTMTTKKVMNALKFIK